MHECCASSYSSAPISAASSIADHAYDGVICISHSYCELEKYESLRHLQPSIVAYQQIHRGVENTTTVIPVDKNVIPSGRLIFAGTGPVTRDQDDVRRFGTAARSAMKLALKAGVKAPLIVTLPHKKYPQAELVAALGAVQELYIPRNVREEEWRAKVKAVGLYALDYDPKTLVKLVEALDAAFTVTRDIGDSDPQRMSPARVAEYVRQVFSGTVISSQVVSNIAEIEREHPLMAAVNRAANSVKEHQAHLIWLEYTPEGPYDETVMLVGKGVTIDTGGADLKTEGNMFGMSRDNIGSNSYTCDEIIRSRSGKRIAIYNTDAEGRITMLDPLTRMVELAAKETKPRLFTLATLTGHAVLTYGYMAAAMDNGPAHKDRTAEMIQDRGDAYGQPVEISRLHSEVRFYVL
ncbi:unnamed protein product [Gongylonema pulchrum]|uniref:Cytosol aminopeptidase domain-containing protein n=1 Tax=Gongylonema pulchrum TaxID=637853 RepID=A0A3P7QM40_9BILA|nr:unnamed protein product [Gongylonema pulchrum]